MGIAEGWWVVCVLFLFAFIYISLDTLCIPSVYFQAAFGCPLFLLLMYFLYLPIKKE